MQYSAYDKYTESDIKWLPLIPAHWRATSFSRFLKGIKDGTHGTHVRYSDGYPLLSAKNVFNDRLDIRHTESTVSEEDHKAITSNGFPAKNDLLVTCVGTIGRSYVYDLDEPIAFQRSVAFLRLEEGRCPQYYKYLIESKGFQEYLLSVAKVSAQGGVYMGDLAKSPVLDMPLVEQQSIAKFLDYKTQQIDRLIEKKKALIEKLNEQRIAVITQAVTKGLDKNAKMKPSGVDWLGDVPDHWDVKAIKRSCMVSRGASPRPIQDPKYFDEDGEYAWVRIADVTANDHYLRTTTQRLSEVGKSFSVPLEPGSLFLSIAGSVGKPMITDIKCCIHDGFVYFPHLSIDPEYLYYIFLSGQCYLGLGKLGTQLNLNTDTVGAIKIGVPSEPEQAEIVEFLHSEMMRIDLMIEKVNSAIDLLNEYRTAMITDAVTGKIDVRDVVLEA